jgi:hypothetical protein
MSPGLELQHALEGAQRPPPRPTQGQRRAIVIGASSALGWAVLEHLLALGRFDRVGTPARRSIHVAFDRLHMLDDHDPQALEAFAPDTALIVFDRAQTSHGRGDAFVHLQPGDLASWASRLQAAGVRRLVVVVPHAPSMLPMALQQGLATLDEAAVAALGYEQLVFMRMARAGEGGAAAPGFLQGVAHWMLSQLHWLVPQREQPVRVQAVAKVAATLALRLADAPAATRVLPAAVLWHATQHRSVDDTLEAWLNGLPLPSLPGMMVPRM